jgi:hypothetical protein
MAGPADAVSPVEAPPSPPLPAAAVQPAPANGAPPLTPEAARLIRRVRRMLVVSSLTTVLAVGAVFSVVGYRLFKAADRLPPPPPPPAPAPEPAQPPQAPVEATLALPKNARIIYTAVAEDLLVVSLDIDGAIEIRTYDLKTLKPAGRMSFSEVP